MEDHNQQLAPMLPVFKRSHIDTQQTFFRALLVLEPASKKPPSLLSVFRPKLGWNWTPLAEQLRRVLVYVHGH